MAKKNLSLESRTESFSFAASGWSVLLRTQPNFRIHAVMALTALGLSLWLGIPRAELALIILSIAFVLAAEAFNTSVEMTINMISSKRTWPAKWAKDISAAAVLVAALGALAVGLLILGPPLYEKLLEMI